jgi:hypothetical protein
VIINITISIGSLPWAITLWRWPPTLHTLTFHLQGSQVQLGCLPDRSQSPGRNSAQDPLVRDATMCPITSSLFRRAKFRPEMCQASVHHSVFHHFIHLMIRYNAVYISNTAFNVYQRNHLFRHYVASRFIYRMANHHCFTSQQLVMIQCLSFLPLAHGCK